MGLKDAYIAGKHCEGVSERDLHLNQKPRKVNYPELELLVERT